MHLLWQEGQPEGVDPGWQEAHQTAQGAHESQLSGKDGAYESQLSGNGGAHESQLSGNGGAYES